MVATGSTLPLGLPLASGVEQVVTQCAFDTALTTLTTTRFVATSEFSPGGNSLGGQEFLSIPLSQVVLVECKRRRYNTYPFRVLAAVIGLIGTGVIVIERSRTPVGNSHLYWAVTHGWFGIVLLLGGAVLWWLPREKQVVTLDVTDTLHGKHSYDYTGDTDHGPWVFAGRLASSAAAPRP